MDIWKEVLCLGRQMDPKTKLWFTITPKRIRDAHKNARKMLSRGVPLPACWEHQDIEAGDAPPDADGIAEWKRAYARYTFAHIGDSRINDRGNLELRHDDVRPEDAKVLERCKFVSPKIYDGYADSRGGQYDGCTVVHVAATPSPVQHWQRPWELSDPTAMYLSYSRPPEDENCPLYDGINEWLDELAAVELSATPSEESAVAEENDEKPAKKEGGEGGDGGGKDADFAALIKALKAKGMNIPDRVEDMAGLIIAIESNGGGAPEPDGDEDNGNPDDDMPATEAPAGGAAPMVMSTLDPNPKRKKVAQRYAVDERAAAVARIEAAFKGDGKVGRDAPTARQLLRRAKGVEMSFTADLEAGGARWTKLLADIAAYEKSEPGVSLKAPGIDLSSTQGVDRPAGLDEAAAVSAEARAVIEKQAELATRYSIRRAK